MPDSISLLAMLAVIGVKVLALVGMGALAAWALRRSSAACRHALWTAVLASVFVIAVTASAPTMWSLPIGDVVNVLRLAGAEAPEPDTIPEHAAQLSTQEVEQSPANRSAAPVRARAWARACVWAGDALVLLWIAGVAFFVLRIGAAHSALRRIVARSRPIEAGRARTLFERLARTSRVARRTRMIESDALCVPATWGVLRPVIALPTMARDWPLPRLESALRHELAHVRRRDVLTQRGAELCCALLWFHPAVWFAARRMRWERERACDDAVLASGGPGVDYAEWLLALAEGISRGGRCSAHAGVAMAEAHSLEDRLRAILDPAITRSNPRMMMVSVPAVALIVTVSMAGLDVRGSTHPGSEEIQSGERLPMSPEQELWALGRQFRPRDAREAQAIERLTEAARHQKQHPMDLVRERGVWALSIAREQEALAPLMEELSSDDWRVRSYAAWSLGLVGAADAREALTALLRDPVWRVRAMAATALAELADPRSTEDMLALLSDSAWQVRLAVVEFLARVQTPEGLAALRARVNDPHVAVRSAATAALGEPRNP